MMERISFEIERQETVEAMHSQAEAHGHSVEAELAALVERTYGPTGQNNVDSRTRIDRLLALGRGLDFEPPPRQTFIVDEPEL